MKEWGKKRTLSIAKRNHYLPQFYLEAFLSKVEPRVFWVFDKKGGPPRPQTPINTGVEGHLYNIEMPDGSIDDSFERQVFAPVEALSKPLIARLQEPGARMSPDDAQVLATFLGFMATRVPRTINAVQEIGGAIAIHMLQDLAEKPERLRRALTELQEQGKLDKDITLDQARELLENAEKGVEYSMDRKAAMGMALLTAQEIHRDLLDMKWSLFEAPRGFQFLTGDMPLVCFVPSPDGTALFGAGSGLRAVEVTFPISPEKCLFLSRGIERGHCQIHKNYVMELNRRTAWAAERFIIARDNERFVARLAKWASKSAGMKKIDRKAMLLYLKASRALTDESLETTLTEDPVEK